MCVGGGRGSGLGTVSCGWEYYDYFFPRSRPRMNLKVIIILCKFLYRVIYHAATSAVFVTSEWF